jgi:hypothetical protein
MKKKKNTLFQKKEKKYTFQHLLTKGRATSMPERRQYLNTTNAE